MEFKKKIALTFAVMGAGIFVSNAQTGIGTNNPDNSAQLDVYSNKRGVLLPRLQLVRTTEQGPVTGPVASLLIYNTSTINDVTPGFYYWEGTKWVRIARSDESTFANLTPDEKASLKGDIGPEGPKGDTGSVGKDGTSVTIKGSKSSESLLPDTGNAVGDGYIIAGNLWVWDGAKFNNVGPIQGPKGDAGAQGIQGLVGATGTQGTAGAKGDKGDTGLQGIQGLAGATGTQGTAGVKGDKGDAGLQGIQGLAGATGAQGTAGAVGAKGDAGLQGIQGIQGLVGQTGAKGDKGDKGDTGLQGIQGLAGATGTQGTVGAKGDKGDVGLQGIQGLAGAQGTAGVKGDTGLQGIQGLVGATGVQGLKGDTGLVGKDGTSVTIKGSKDSQSLLPVTGNVIGDGYIIAGNLWVWDGTKFNNVGPIQGPKGDAGVQGIQGLAGATGAQGTIGSTGAKGDKGDAGTQGIQGLVGATGAVGAAGAKGDAGVQGIQGLAGATGAQGTAGAKGDKGDVGIQGIQGLTGVQGLIGLTGATGAKGDTGLSGATVTRYNLTSTNSALSITGAGKVMDANTTMDISGGTAGQVLTSNGSSSAAWKAVTGDNLGNHIATQDLVMSARNINGALNVTASGTVTAANVAATTKVTTPAAQITTGAGLNKIATSDAAGNVVWTDPATIAAKGDDLGNHTATKTLNMVNNNIDNILNANVWNAVAIFDQNKSLPNYFSLNKKNGIFNISNNKSNLNLLSIDENNSTTSVRFLKINNGTDNAPAVAGKIAMSADAEGSVIWTDPAKIATKASWFDVDTKAAATANTQSIYQMSTNMGIGTATPHAQLQLGNSVSDRKIVMYEDANNDNQFYGFGVQSSLLKLQAPAFSFNSAVDATSSKELMRLNAAGLGIGTTKPSNALHVVATTNPLRLEGLQNGLIANTLLSADANGVVTKVPVGTSGQALTTDASGKMAWSNVPGDNLGNHTATQNLEMSNKDINNINSANVNNQIVFTDRTKANTKTTYLYKQDGFVNIWNQASNRNDLAINETTGKTTLTAMQIVQGTDGVTPKAGYLATSLDTAGNIVWKDPATIVAKGETITSLLYNGANNSLIYTNEAGNALEYKLTDLVSGAETLTSLVVNTNNGTLDYKDEKNRVNQLDIAAAVKEPWFSSTTNKGATLNTESIYTNGWVGIGYKTPSTAPNEKLRVNGAISTVNTYYADYVFEDYFKGFSNIKAEYKFKQLSEIEAYIKKNNHLPGITPITELEKTKEGYSFNMSELSVQLLEKTEEIYLHIIEQNKQLEAKEAEIKELKAATEAMNVRLAKVEKLLENK
ncbi:hypothetical protein OIU83_12825 [Flavobacterium sp. LS1R49]|uniref:Collagen triple helix repeat-containing protein n=1 Tax=Flavobacterium shii TaxID=2987687 RepID=A0A9X3C4Q6_9FLAO|nr:hypothetical protein [Flavobacterium shii]MCV9928544.1 hypothetical protein [Flavobacterium shii]